MYRAWKFENRVSSRPSFDRAAIIVREISRIIIHGDAEFARSEREKNRPIDDTTLT